MGDPHPKPRLPARTFRVVLDTFEFDARDAAALDVVARLAGRQVISADSAPWGENGFRGFVGDVDFVARFRAETQAYQTRTYRSVFLLMASDQETKVAIVEGQVPRVVSIPVYQGRIQTGSLDVAPSGSGFVARARLVDGGLVDLRLTPWMVSAGGKDVRLDELSTRIEVEPGRPFAIRGVKGDTETVGSLLFSRRTETGRRVVLQFLTVEVP